MRFARDGNIIVTVDGCFLADNDRLYYYWSKNFTDSVQLDAERVIGTVGVELDPEKPWQMLTKPVMVNCFDPSKVWQRWGEKNQNLRMGWIEGQWMYKRGSRYYLLYSGCGTEFGAYANGIMYSDEGPLTGFNPQKNHDPFTEKRVGFTRGAGHGCLVDGPNDTIWTFYTSIFCYNHMFERRIGMDQVHVDTDDASENCEDLCVDYREIEPAIAYSVRLKICGMPCGIQPGVVDFTVFGKCVTSKEN